MRLSPNETGTANAVPAIRMSPKGLKWLKGFHLVAVACWIGGALSLLALYFLKAGVADGGELYGINRSIHHVDMNIVVLPGAIGSLATGLAYSLFSNWGFFRHRWITVKWIATLSAIIFGTFWLGPWETAMMEISGRIGIAALQDSAYLRNQYLNFFFGSLQVAVLIVLVFVSIFKPWKQGRGAA